MAEVQVITRNSENQPSFHVPIPEHEGYVEFHFLGRKYLVSAAKAEELKIELDHAVVMARVVRIRA